PVPPRRSRGGGGCPPVGVAGGVAGPRDGVVPGFDEADLVAVGDHRQQVADEVRPRLGGALNVLGDLFGGGLGRERGGGVVPDAGLPPGRRLRQCRGYAGGDVGRLRGRGDLREDLVGGGHAPAPSSGGKRSRMQSHWSRRWRWMECCPRVAPRLRSARAIAAPCARVRSMATAYPSAASGGRLRMVGDTAHRFPFVLASFWISLRMASMLNGSPRSLVASLVVGRTRSTQSQAIVRGCHSPPRVMIGCAGMNVPPRVMSAWSGVDASNSGGSAR